MSVVRYGNASCKPRDTVMISVQHYVVLYCTCLTIDFLADGPFGCPSFGCFAVAFTVKKSKRQHSSSKSIRKDRKTPSLLRRRRGRAERVSSAVLLQISHKFGRTAYEAAVAARNRAA